MPTTLFSELLRLPPDNSWQDSLRLAVELGIQTVDADEGSLLVLDETRKDLVFTMTVGDSASEQTLIGQRVPLGSGLTGLAALTGEVQVGTPTYAALRQAEHRAAAGPRFIIAAPMFAHEQLVGVLTAASFTREQPFTPEHAARFGRVAALAGIVVAAGQREQNQAAIQAGEIAASSPKDEVQQDIAAAIHRIAHADETRLRTVLALLTQIETLSGQ